MNKCKIKAKIKIQITTPTQYWFLQVQKEMYPTIRAILLGEEKRHKSHQCHKMIRDLGLFMDPQGLIRCRGRLDYARVGKHTNQPYLISGESHVTKMWIRYLHEGWHHAGVNETLVASRQCAWIPKGRQIVKRILRGCVTCNRFQRPLLTQPGPPPLPLERVNYSRPFQDVGVDYTGAILIKDADRDHQLVKVYVCLFTCMSSRAVHLEIAKDNSALTFANL